MKLSLVPLVLITFFLTGCGSSTAGIFPSQSVVIEVQKSPQNKIEHTLKPVGQKINQAMTEVQIPYKIQTRGQGEAMVELAGVISTSGKTWHLYINNEPQPIEAISQTSLTDSANISWRYEDINP